MGYLGAYVVGPGILCEGQILCTKTQAQLVGDPQQIHVTMPGNGAEGFAVSWATAARVTHPRVDYRARNDIAWTTVTATTAPRIHNGLLAVPGRFHHAVIGGLKPGTSYQYRVSNTGPDGRTLTSEVFDVGTLPHFTTTPVRLAFVADLGLKGRPDGLTSGADAIKHFLAEDKLNLILGGGDYAYTNRDGRFTFPESGIDEWFREWQPILARIPFLPAWGNHECCLTEGVGLWTPRFVLPPSRSPDKLSYSFDIGDAHITSFFSPGSRRHLPTGEALAWLDRDLQDARARGARWLIVYQHEPIFGHGKSHKANPIVRARLAPVLERNKVDLHLSAHDQSYERTFPVTNAARGAPVVGSREKTRYAGWTGVTYAKVSPAGKRSERTRDFSILPPTRPEFMAVADDTAHHYAVLTLQPNGRLDYVAYSVFDDGRRAVLDQFTLTGTATPPP